MAIIWLPEMVKVNNFNKKFYVPSNDTLQRNVSAIKQQQM